MIDSKNITETSGNFCVGNLTRIELQRFYVTFLIFVFLFTRTFATKKKYRVITSFIHLSNVVSYKFVFIKKFNTRIHKKSMIGFFLELSCQISRVLLHFRIFLSSGQKRRQNLHVGAANELSR